MSMATATGKVKDMVRAKVIMGASITAIITAITIAMRCEAGIATRGIGCRLG